MDNYSLFFYNKLYNKKMSKKILFVFIIVVITFGAIYAKACVENTTLNVVNVQCADGSNGFIAIYINGTFCSAIDPLSAGCKDAKQCVQCNDGSQACTPRLLQISKNKYG